MGLVAKDDGWRIPEELWNQMEPLLPPRKEHPLGCHNPRVPDRNAMNAILFRLRTGCQWNALDATGICSCSSAYRRFREWLAAGVFLLFWKLGLLNYDALKGLDWSWLALDAAMTKAPLGGEKNRAQPDGSRQGGHKKEHPDGGRRHSAGACGRGRQHSRHENGSRNAATYRSGTPGTYAREAATPLRG
jgi:transposase